MSSDPRPPRAPDLGDDDENDAVATPRRPDAGGAIATPGIVPGERAGAPDVGGLAKPGEVFSPTVGINPGQGHGAADIAAKLPGTPGIIAGPPPAPPDFGGMVPGTPGIVPGQPGVPGLPGAPGLPNVPDPSQIIGAAAGGVAAAAGGMAATASGAVGAASGVVAAASGGIGAAAGAAAAAAGGASGLLGLAELAGPAAAVAGAAGAVIGGLQSAAQGGISSAAAAAGQPMSFVAQGAMGAAGQAGESLQYAAQQAAGAAGALGGAVGAALGGMLAARAGRNLEVEIASGDKLDIRQFSIHERLSSIYTIHLIAVSGSLDINFDEVIGKDATFTLHGGLHTRKWSGICNYIQQIRVEEGGINKETLATYELSIVPDLWFLTQRRNYRMFQQESELDIVKKLLEEWSIKFEEKLTETYKPRKYRVQYAETDYAFMCRMLEDVGITFYFGNENGETKLVLADAPQKNPLRADKLAYRDNPMDAPNEEHATGVRIGHRVRPGKYTMRDHDYRLPPSYQLMKTAEAKDASIEARLERYHYTPGAFLFRAEKGEDTPVADDRGKTRTDEKEAEALAKKRLDAKRATAKVATFETNAHDLAPGTVMSMRHHPKSELDAGKKLLVRESSVSGTDSGEWAHYCEVVSADVPYRPELVTPKPKVSGVESATVVGPPGEEIHCDEFGRVRVHFHWDRDSQMNAKSSCWIHVSQPWGGAGYGGMNLPRVGQEVLVDFLGGDPDRPVIVGRVYTNLQKVPYKLPDNKTQSGWKSSSTGGKGGYNEIMFEDAEGKELINIQAQKDLTELVKNDATHTVKNNRTTTVWKNDSSLVGVQQSLTIASPGEGAPAPGPTSMVMVHEKITFTTGKASIIIDGADIILSASGNIGIGAKMNVNVGAEEESILIGAKQVVQIDGIDAVFINCTEPPPPPLESSGPSFMEVLGALAVGTAVAAAIVAAPVAAGVLLGAAVAAGAMAL